MPGICDGSKIITDCLVWQYEFSVKGGHEDNLMRVVSGDIAAEVMEMTFVRRKK